jgi:hypothetical protein
MDLLKNPPKELGVVSIKELVLYALFVLYSSFFLLGAKRANLTYYLKESNAPLVENFQN